MDDRGRLCDQAVMRALGWAPQDPVALEVQRGVIVVTAAGSGTTTVSRYGYLRIPAALRHRVGLRAGDRVLLSARPDRQTLTVYPPAVLDVLLDVEAE